MNEELKTIICTFFICIAIVFVIKYWAINARITSIENHKIKGQTIQYLKTNNASDIVLTNYIKCSY